MMGILLAHREREGSAGESPTNADTHGKPKGDLAFDNWLTHHLSQLYGPVANEPLPADLLRLLEERLK
jgi:hypothetical protein